MTVRAILASAAAGVLAAAAFFAAPAGAQEAPQELNMSDEELYAATCINAGMLLKRGAEEGTEQAVLLDQALNFWLQRHSALEPDEAARQQQWVTAAQMIVETTGEDPAAIQPALVLLMANCQARRSDILAALANPGATN